ncbi:hypothetical protein [Kibdelosporangium phytohabitans]|nr:hypothetical protein [Kibdelosporangium phytohabitans]MBE1470528.1 hypothetical protein [Kibdelosporangium phytohabitans]
MDEALGTGELVSGRDHLAGQVLFDRPRTRPAAGPVDEAIPGAGCFRWSQRFELAPVPRRAPFVAAYLVVRFDDPAIVLRQPSGTSADPAVVVAVSEVPGGYGWLLGDPLGDAPLPQSGEAHAVVHAPIETVSVTGELRMDVTTLGQGWRVERRHAVTARPVRFTLTPPGEWTSTLVRPAADKAVTGRAPAVRLCMAADTEAYSRLSVGESARAQSRLVNVLTYARAYAGLRESDVDIQRSGDGQFAILPAGVDESVVIPRLVAGIKAALAETNADLSDHARLRLRVALHRGHVAPGMNGWVGGATIAVHRLLDCLPLRDALAREPTADFALIVPEVLYKDIIADGYGGLDPREFSQVDAVLPSKNFAERAWVHAPRR